MTAVLIELAAGGSEPAAPGEDPSLALPGLRALSAAAETAGVAALRLIDPGPASGVVDPSVAAAWLAGGTRTLGYVVDVRTTHQAPYNVARRLLSLDRSSDGLGGLTLRPGRGDEVSDTVAPGGDPRWTDDAVGRWREYAHVVTRLWDSFPPQALVGDQDSAVVVDETVLFPIDHAGRHYRVAGPLDGPATAHGRPVLLADVAEVGWRAGVESADVVVVEWADVDSTSVRLDAALRETGRRREDLALLARRRVTVGDLADPSELAEHVRLTLSSAGLDGVVLVPEPDLARSVVDHLVPRLAGRRASTLRERLGLPTAARLPVA